MRTIRGILLVIAAAASLPLAAATEVAGVKFEDHIKLGSSDLVLNGAGLRVRVFFKVYAMGLYLAEKKSDPAQAVALKGPKRAHIVLLREVAAEDFAEALVSGLKSNSSEAEFAAIRDRAEQLRAAILEAKEVTKGTVVDLDYLPEAGTRLTIRGKAQGRDIGGEDFYQALLRIWLGAKPVQDDLKNALLGRPAG